MDFDSSVSPDIASDRGTRRGKNIFLWTGGIILIAVCVMAVTCLGLVFLYVSIMSKSLTRDCYWQADAIAFEDLNKDGIYQIEEPPMEGIKLVLFVFYKKGGQKGPESSFLTGEDGKVNIGTFLPGCPDVEFKIIPQSPVGYKLTTPSEFTTDDYHIQEPIPFGFVSE